MTKITDFDRNNWGNPPDYEDGIEYCQKCRDAEALDFYENYNQWLCEDCKIEMDETKFKII